MGKLKGTADFTDCSGKQLAHVGHFERDKTSSKQMANKCYGWLVHLKPI